jgi:RimJ/RimL family protein N-acetyltransferase
MIAPTLHTERLTLRVPVLADFPAFAAFWATSRAQYMGGPCDKAAAWFWFSSDIAMWHLFGHGALMVDLRQSGETVGQVGINAGPLYPETELGWMLYGDHEGQGYATEAAAALRDWAFATLPLNSLVSYVYPDNRASALVAERLGAVLDPDAPRQVGDETDLVYRHRRAA